MNVTESNDIRTLLHWLTGDHDISDDRAHDALVRLDTAAAKRLLLGSRTGEVLAAVTRIADLRAAAGHAVHHASTAAAADAHVTQLRHRLDLAYEIGDRLARTARATAIAACGNADEFESCDGTVHRQLRDAFGEWTEVRRRG
ncbi:MAG: hypothetical protein HOV79_00270 [Hamadaea sp.]|nr:hypothetical protein [Hamadaea sp.]